MALQIQISQQNVLGGMGHTRNRNFRIPNTRVEREVILVDVIL